MPDGDKEAYHANNGVFLDGSERLGPRSLQEVNLGLAKRPFAANGNLLPDKRLFPGPKPLHQLIFPASSSDCMKRLQSSDFINYYGQASALLEIYPPSILQLGQCCLFTLAPLLFLLSFSHSPSVLTRACPFLGRVSCCFALLGSPSITNTPGHFTLLVSVGR